MMNWKKSVITSRDSFLTKALYKRLDLSNGLKAPNRIDNLVVTKPGNVLECLGNLWHRPAQRHWGPGIYVFTTSSGPRLQPALYY